MVTETEHLDLESFSQLKDIMEGDFGLLIQTFLDDSALRIKTLQQAISAQDAELVRTAAHSFKGSSGNICAIKLADYCRDLEKAGKDADLSNAPKLLADIEAEFALVKTLIA